MPTAGRAKSAAVQEIDVPCTQGGCNVQNPKWASAVFLLGRVSNWDRARSGDPANL